MATYATTERRGLSTATVARRLDLSPRAMRVRLCQKGSYYGVRPQKLPSGRLLWPPDTVDRLLAQAASGDTSDGEGG
ncbi:hypothetical protein KBTX_02780 [wastewater metagenome]|uniref:DNA-binding protein n=2 Tax=unclassified sequences TaxID=12908 RepID=A0A5B8RG38_9ZZZZ|nr:hypothetical protein KBTEX_02780 [uncultured organism]